MDKIPCAVLGCTGLVGQYFVKLLIDHPIFEIRLLTASEKSAKRKFGEAVKWMLSEDIPKELMEMLVETTSLENILGSGVKVVFSALPSSIATDIEKNLRERGLFVFSNSSSNRMDEIVPILIPEINPDHIKLAETQKKKFGGFIITNSNCTTSGLVLALKPLLDFGIKRVFMSSYQSVSGAGRRGLPSMDILGNAIPFIKDEEEKVEQETRKILGILKENFIQNLKLEMFVNCCRIPTKIGHLESVVVELERDFTLEEIFEKFESFKGEPQNLNLPTAPERPLIVRFEEGRPQPEIDSDAGSPERAKGMAVSIGRIRKKGKFLSFFLLVNNLIRGSAGGSILNAEFAYFKRIIGGKMKVMKFGGGCLRDEKDFLNVAQIIKSEKEKLVIVVSAVYGVTDLLIEAMGKALISEREIDRIVEKIKDVHFEICEKGIVKNEIKVMVRKEIGSRIEKLRKNLYGICYTSEITDSVKAMILSYGERYSAFLLSGILKSEGVKAEAFESDRIGIVTDESYDNASANLQEAEKNLKSHLLPVLKIGVVPVITGYFGCTPSGKVSLFGRNGSDYSASVIAYALDASLLQIWKDVDGFMSADPKIVKNAKVLEKLSYNEAAELSYFGAKILHPRTVEPVSLKNIPLVIKNMKEPEKAGTLITHEKNEIKDIIKSVTYNRQISILRIQGAGVGYKPGIISEIGKKLSEKNINIYSIITSQTCINLIIDRNDSEESLRCLKSLEGGVIEKVEKIEDMALVAVVGEGISRREGIAGRVFSAVAREGVNIEMMSGGASEVAYYFIIKEEPLEKVINAVHSEFF